ncbi:MAG: response regulator [Synergistaceae bacterium]|jgi:putative two-component system response regulator|nr:response regulator [Synergistaceae bacterium]
MKEILVTDDNIASLKQISSQLEGSYNVSLAKSGAQALSICAHERPDLILLDVEMPDMDGFETLSALKKNLALSRIPVIFVTGNRDSATEIRGLELGARDFITKPPEKSILLHRIKLHLRISSYQAHLEKAVTEMTDGIAVSLADLIECRDENTGGHVFRTSQYVELLGRKLLTNGLFEDELSGDGLAMMVRAAPLHDIGKIAISDRVLLKPGRLDDEEFEMIKKHAEIGAEILGNMYERTPTQSFLLYAKKIAASHHERFDGLGYPNGISGDDIPLYGRIMAVADVYDALMDDRVYRKKMVHTEARRIISNGSRTQFDPRIVEVFDAFHIEFAELARQGALIR